MSAAQPRSVGAARSRPVQPGPAAGPRRPTNDKPVATVPDPGVDSYSRLLWWLFASSAGASTRGRIVATLRAEPRNAQQLANELGVDYTTVRHHLKVLRENRLIESTGEHYGQVYSVAPHVEARWAEFESILARHRKK